MMCGFHDLPSGSIEDAIVVKRRVALESRRTDRNLSLMKVFLFTNSCPGQTKHTLGRSMSFLPSDLHALLGSHASDEKVANFIKDVTSETAEPESIKVYPGKANPDVSD